MIVSLAAVLVAAPALAKADAATGAAERYQHCIERVESNPEWALCGGGYLAALDAALNRAWLRAISDMDKEAHAQLLTEQRAWLRYRDASCQIDASGTLGREGQVLHFFSCRGPVIEARIRALTSLYDLTHQDESAQ